ncbi:MAG: hypothetical protein SAJ12_02445 [Jaaginema sp. PMC 1079.18]|nr:hypothetical protein [Jaaginema sp. PMC 1080.18]MEC4849849.1 hypothetical protein [Jaaginema sp. PMC 1079.18]MEC4865237.1 hypothetical protein [Jaaginema sp. PMC 1078.18]
MANLIAPTLDLFVYDIRKEFGQTLVDLQNNRTHFRQKLPADFDDASWERDRSFESDFVELLSDKTQLNTIAFVTGDCQGYYYPVRLQDNYGVLISCSARDKNFAYPVPWLKEAQEILEEKLAQQTTTLGQTWMISAQFDWQTSTHNNPEFLAKECYLALFPNRDWQENLKSVNTFLGGTFFEISQYKVDFPESFEDVHSEAFQSNYIEENHHIIIAIYPDSEVAAAAAYFLDDWLKLWSYRHQVLASYSQSRLLKQILESDIMTIQQYLEKFKKEVHRGYSLAHLDLELEQIEDIYANYTLDLFDFKNQISKITEGCESYTRQIENLESVILSERLAADLSGLKQFIPEVSQQYLWQVDRDWRRLQDGEKLLDATFNLLRTEISIYQAKNNRDFQQKAIATGIGLGCGFVVGAIAYRIATVEMVAVAGTPETPETPSPQDGLQSLITPEVWAIPGIAIIIGACTAILTGGIARLWLFWGDRSFSQQR